MKPTESPQVKASDNDAVQNDGGKNDGVKKVARV